MGEEERKTVKMVSKANYGNPMAQFVSALPTIV